MKIKTIHIKIIAYILFALLILILGYVLVKKIGFLTDLTGAF